MASVVLSNCLEYNYEAWNKPTNYHRNETLCKSSQTYFYYDKQLTD